MDAFHPPPPPPGCGDGVVTASIGEECDDGAANSDDPASALATCTTGCKRRAGCGPLAGAAAALIDPSTGHCYVAWPGPLNWASAGRECQRNGGDLISIGSQSENDIARSLAGNVSHWLGISTPPGATPAFTNVDGTPVSYTNWAPGEPDTTGHCVRLGSDGWHSDSCGWPSNGGLPSVASYTLAYVCESSCGNGKVDPGETCDPPGPTCSKTCQTIATCTEAGGVSLAENGHCYFPTATALPYSAALAAACPSGTHLATLNFPAETEAALKAIAADSWIALSAMQTLGLFQWDVPGAIFDATRYHDFGGNDPNQPPPAGVVVTNTPPSGPPGWRDRATTDNYVSLCERD
jgi:hypothetical protein